MSDHLKKITDRAKKIRAKKPSMKWTDAVKQASIELGLTKAKTPGRKPGAVIYARQSKTKTGKTRTKVYARAKPVRKSKANPGANMDAFSKPRKPKPTPKRGKSSSYVTPGGRVYTKTSTGRKKILGDPRMVQLYDLKTNKPVKLPARRKDPTGSMQTIVRATAPGRESQWGYVYTKTGERYYPNVFNLYLDKPEVGNPLLYTYLATKVMSNKNNKIGKVEVQDYILVYEKTGLAVPKLPITVKDFRGTSTKLVGASIPNRPGTSGYVYTTDGNRYYPSVFGLKWILKSTYSPNTKLNGLQYKGGKPMLSLAGYPMRGEKIFLGTTATTCTKMRKCFNKKPKNIGELQEVYSVPEVKVELLGRKAVKSTYQIRNSSGSADLIRTYINDKYPGILQTRELFGCLYLNRQNRVLGVYVDGIGGQVSVVVDSKFVLVVGLKLACQSAIIFHNHPSGNMQPSTPDERLTKDLKEGFSTLDITLMDHIILSGVDNDYYSFSDQGNIL